METSVDTWTWEGHRLVYETHGEGPRVFVFIHGLLLDATLNRAIAQLLAQRGHRVILPELLGHGRSDRPPHAYEYRMEFWAEQTVALLDHLELSEAVIGGVSLGANVTLQVAQDHPERLRAMVLEMPVLERGTLVGAATFLPLMVALRYLPQVFRPLTALARALPRTGHPVDSFLNLVAGDARELAAVLHGLFVGPSTPSARSRRRLDMPTLVLGHGLDLLHPIDDAQALAHELPNTTFVHRRSILEARSKPDEMEAAVGDFLDLVWAPRKAPDAELA